MKKSILKYGFLAVMLFATSMLFAQEPDAEGCKDHPIITRMSNFHIYECSEAYDEFEIVTGLAKTKKLEGTVYKYFYLINSDIKEPSHFQILKNYENAILSKGGEKIYTATKSDDEGFRGATYRMKSGNDLYWLVISDMDGNEGGTCPAYMVYIIKMEGMQQEIAANEMFEKINSGNALSLYINFETGKSIIKSESQNIVDELYQMMKDNQVLKISIEGHTDNVGDKASNQSLSENRAASLKAALVKKGISTDRIKTVGFGQDKPVADNSTEDGKAKNRRVEIKKL